ncbi:MAG: OmpP1/FadL family transporter [Bacteriovoracia bacterium]
MRAKIFLLAAVCFFSVNARAELGSLFGMGPLSGGLGGTSLFQGRQSPYQTLNAPASLGLIHQVQVDLSAQYFDPKLLPFGTVTLNSSGTLGTFDTSGVLSGGGSLIGVAIPFGRERPLTVGAVIYMPFSTLIRISGQPVDHPFYPLYTDVARNFFFSVGAGYEFVDGWAFGVNLRSTTKSVANYTLRTSNSVNYSASVVEGKSESRPSFSLLYDHERATKGEGTPYTLGLMYRAQAGLETKLIADVTTFVPIEGSITSMPVYTPAEWALLYSGRVGEHFTLAADFAWAKWSKYVSPYGSGNINTYLVGDLRREANFKDIPVGRFGVDYSTPQNGWLRKLSYRAGYSYHPSPVPDQTQDSNFVDNNRHSFTAGLGTAFENFLREHDFIDLDLFFQYNWLVRRQVRKESSTNVGAPGYVTGGKIFVYGLGASFKF